MQAADLEKVMLMAEMETAGVRLKWIADNFYQAEKTYKGHQCIVYALVDEKGKQYLRVRMASPAHPINFSFKLKKTCKSVQFWSTMLAIFIVLTITYTLPFC